eukprot:CAMPEP_0172472152 /NCGR_PEP_ID=MMETSP1065-20121228/68190_1 /TAXON_ID=265537 /ORGANISM="Amphiprora paludosa, Strain CCMP125" /LENGTH=740 /DNA_ID=CAMNT_0013230281 /DNA_START=508 /DNA_END=2730 /DNA_ORIENTATION=-
MSRTEYFYRVSIQQEWMGEACIHPFAESSGPLQAKQVTLRRWRSPIHLPKLISDNTESKSSQQDNGQNRTLLPRINSIIQEHKLICAFGETNNQDDGSPSTDHCYYEVVNVKGEDGSSIQDGTKNDQLNPQVYISGAQTEYRVETLVRPWSCPQLPRHDKNFLAPHPNLASLVRAMQLAPTSTARQRVLLVVGTQQEHGAVDAVRSASHVLGRNCLVIHGLAAHAHRCNGRLSRSASLVDKLNGLQTALDQAYSAAPSVLFVENVDLELTSWNQDGRLRQDEESRLWSRLVATTAQGGVDADENDDICRVPSVIIVLSMTAMPTQTGALLENMVWDPVSLSLPNPEYTKFQWYHSNGPVVSDTSMKLLEGRTVKDISILAEQVRDDLHFQATVTKTNDEARCQQVADAFLHTRCKEERHHQSSASANIPQVQWSDVGGLDHVRNEILETIELPLLHPKLFSGQGRAGILLYGPPGTGKTLVAKAVANECGLPFLSVKGPELLGSYVGESEANVRAVFAQARELAKRSVPKQAAILFFDELDSLAPRRGDQQTSGGGGVMDRVVATFFTELDMSQDGLSIFCIGATNRPDMLDPNLLRPGRLERAVYLGLSDLDQSQILEVHLAKLKLADGMSAKEMAAAAAKYLSKNLTGADLATVAKSALVRATERLCNQAEAEMSQQNSTFSSNPITIDHVLAQWGDEQLEPIVQFADILDGAEDVVPSVDDQQIAQFEKIRQQMESN